MTGPADTSDAAQLVKSLTVFVESCLIGFVHKDAETGLQTTLIRGLGSERDDAEREVIEAGVSLPLQHRVVWAENLYRSEPLFLVVREGDGRVRAGFAIENLRTRAIPGYKTLRVVRFGGDLPIEVCQAAVQGLTELARSTPRVLWLQLNVFSRHGRDAIGESLQKLGYRQIVPPSSYQHTLVVDLVPSEDEIFATFSTNGRRRVREAIRKSLKPLVIEDADYADQLSGLQSAAFQRTGANFNSENWPAILKISKERPDLSRVVGLFEDEDLAPEKMRAFLWGCNHGDHWEYRAAGSIRRTEAPIPFGYLLAWEMIRWAKAEGADWFDMGGVTLAESEDTALEGISRFKRYFSREVAEVGAEWVLEPSPARARVATAVSNCAQRLRGLAKNRC